MDSKSPRGELAASIRQAPDASFDIARKDSRVIRSIVERAFRDNMLRPHIHFIEDPADARLTLTMDIEAVHANGNPINLEKLLDTDDFTFRHDISGIQGNVDRRSGRLRNFFTPRTSLSDAEKAARAETLGKAQDTMGDLLKASEHAGAARAHLDTAKVAQAASSKGAGGERAILVKVADLPRGRKPAAKKSAAKKATAKRPAGRKVVGKATNRRRR